MKLKKSEIKQIEMKVSPSLSQNSCVECPYFNEEGYRCELFLEDLEYSINMKGKIVPGNYCDTYCKHSDCKSCFTVWIPNCRNRFE